MASTEWKLKRCRTRSWLFKRCSIDRLSSLPDDLLSQIFSKISTKEAAAMQVVSKRMGRAFTWIKEVDLDDSPVSLCIKCPRQVERFPLFESFVDNVLGKLSQPLTHFRLGFGGNKTTQLDVLRKTFHRCKQACFPYVEPARLNVWISYPLAHCGLKELDLSFHVGNSDECKLPQGLFTCQLLEVLRLDSNLEVDDGADIPLICLPNLKLLHLRSLIFTEDDFITRLVLSCPCLEDLSITSCYWKKSDHLTISSYSLQRLVLGIHKCDEVKNSDLVHIDTPNLQYLHYTDNLAYRYSIAHVNALVEARIRILWMLRFDNIEISYQSWLSLVRAFSDVQHLSLLRHSVEMIYFAGKLKNQLPVFGNIKTLKLGAFSDGRWDTVLLSILHSTPLLETLVFPEGLFSHIYVVFFCPNDCDREAATLEAKGWSTTQKIPSCCTTRLQRIVFDRCFGFDRELNVIRILLCSSLVLKELVLCMSEDIRCPRGVQFETPNLDLFESSLKKLPRGSNSCTINVQR